jgi:hypothetical protein
MAWVPVEALLYRLQHMFMFPATVCTFDSFAMLDPPRFVRRFNVLIG